MLIALAILVVVPVGIFGVSSWRRSERQLQRWQSRRGVDEGERGQDDRGAYRAHWGGFGRPGRH